MTQTAITTERSFANNRALQAVSGPTGAYLRRIGQLLAVDIDQRGNAVLVSGDRDQVDQAIKALESLYRTAETGAMPEPEEVDAAVRLAGPMVQPPASDQPSAMGSETGTTSAAKAPVLKTRKRSITARTPTQAEYLQAMERHELVFGLGPAGTGKTYLAVAKAVAMRLEGRVERIVLCRPAVEAGERIGYLPGDMREKVDPYLRPMLDALRDMMPADQIERRLDAEEIEIAPIAFMRGRTLTDAFIILDEAQNTTPGQMKMLLTRLGARSRMVITGDPSQVDLSPGSVTGLQDALAVLRDRVPGVGVIRFTGQDVVRHDLVARIVEAYDSRDRDRHSGKDAKR
ncbi:MAG: PhoH family protein [Rhodospirillaceae bacterium]